MKLIVHATVKKTKDLITNYYSDYNIINDSKVDEDTYFIVVEKFFFRNSSRASLSIVISRIDDSSCKVEAIGSGGGQGMIFKFDWGAKESFEQAIPQILNNSSIRYEELHY